MSSTFAELGAPADFAELRVIHKQFFVQGKILSETAKHLADEGAFPAIAKAFRADLGLRLAPDR